MSKSFAMIQMKCMWSLPTKTMNWAFILQVIDLVGDERYFGPQYRECFGPTGRGERGSTEKKGKYGTRKTASAKGVLLCDIGVSSNLKKCVSRYTRRREREKVLKTHISALFFSTETSQPLILFCLLIKRQGPSCRLSRHVGVGPLPLRGKVLPEVVTVQVLIHLEVAKLALELVVGEVVLLQQLLAGEVLPARAAPLAAAASACNCGIRIPVRFGGLLG